MSRSIRDIADQDARRIGRSYDSARIAGREIFGFFTLESAEGEERGGPIFSCATSYLFDVDLSLETLHGTIIEIDGTEYYIDSRRPDGQAWTALQLTAV